MTFAGVWASEASKLATPEKRVQYTHLNLHFDELPASLNVAGALAELAGIQPMTPATAEMLAPPPQKQGHHDPRLPIRAALLLEATPVHCVSLQAMAGNTAKG